MKLFGGEFGPGQLTSFHFILMKLDFISQPTSKSSLPFAGLQHMSLISLKVISKLIKSSKLLLFLQFSWIILEINLQTNRIKHKRISLNNGERWRRDHSTYREKSYYWLLFFLYGRFQITPEAATSIRCPSVYVPDIPCRPY